MLVPAVMNDETLLIVDRVSRTFTRQRGLFGTTVTTAALRELSLDLKKGEILGIVGESGSGKSTLGKIIVGLDHPDAGCISLAGRTLVDRSSGRRITVPAQKRGIGMIFQDPYSSLNPRLTVGDLVAEGLQIAGSLRRSEIEARVVSALVTVGLKPDDIRKHAHQFSGGQRQRIGIARSLVMEPQILIADEAVSALDVSVQMQILNLLLDVRDRLGLSLIFITHNIGVVEYLCDRVVVMSCGEVVEAGDTLAVIDNPRQPYTQALLRAVPRL